jgi:hypothetical protein
MTNPSILEQGMAERARLASAEGQGFSGTDKTSGQGVDPSTINTTKTLLGS